MFSYIVLPSQFTEGRFLVCRTGKNLLTTTVSDHGDLTSAQQERDRLLAEQDKRLNTSPQRPHQLVLGFYGPEHGDV